MASTNHLDNFITVYVTFHGKTYTNDWPLNGLKLNEVDALTVFMQTSNGRLTDI